MKFEKNFNLNKYPAISRFKEKVIYDQQLHAVTIFPYNNIYRTTNFFKLILNFSLKDVGFNKKKALPFFLAMELLTNQKCVATISSKNVILWKLRKDSLVGCKVTLRKYNLYEFLDSLYITIPRMEKFKVISQNILDKRAINSVTLNIGELILFYPIELGLGINTEVKSLDINFIFKGMSVEEKVFLLTANKIPTN